MERPLITFTITYIFGVLLFSRSISVGTLLLVTIFLVVFLIYSAITKKINLWMIILIIIFIISGAILTKVADSQFTRLEQYSKQRVSLQGRVVDVNQSATYQLITLDLIGIDGDAVKGKVSLYLNEYNGNAYSYGDVIRAVSSFNVYRVEASETERSMALRYRSSDIVATANTSHILIDVISKDTSKFNIMKIAFKARQSIKATIRELLPGDEGELTIGVMIGDRLGFSEEFYTDVKESGVAHVVAVSGLHFSIVLLVFTMLVQRFIKRNYLIAIGGIILVLSFFLLVGYTPAIARAIIMTVVTLFACLFNRRSEPFNALSISMLIISIIQPYSIFNLGLQLSFASTLTILLFAVPLGHKVKSYLVNSAIVSLSAMVGTTYITAYYFQNVNIVGILTNFFVVPLTSVMLMGGYLLVLLKFLAEWLAFPMYALAQITKTIIQVATFVPLGNIKVNQPDFFTLLIYIAVVGVLYSLMEVFLNREKQQISD